LSSNDPIDEREEEMRIGTSMTIGLNGIKRGDGNLTTRSARSTKSQRMRDVIRGSEHQTFSEKAPLENLKVRGRC
jgi:hypothetical protein